MSATMPAGRKQVAALVSGGGSNLQALIDAAQAPDCPFAVTAVISNRPDARGIERARQAGIATEVIDHTGFASREAFDAALDTALRNLGAEIVACAGFMRVLTPQFVAAWDGRLVNIHPSLLPLFKGLHTHRRALEAGVAIHGCTVHWVSAGVDEGAIIGQGAVPVLPGDSEAELAARVLAMEHRLYPACLARVARGEAAGHPLALLAS
jgi:phosphoribosylglycinamide formyltransferase 1